jgi:FtsZ-binding cell division protein ZapB
LRIYERGGVSQELFLRLFSGVVPRAWRHHRLWAYGPAFLFFDVELRTELQLTHLFGLNGPDWREPPVTGFAGYRAIARDLSYTFLFFDYLNGRAGIMSTEGAAGRAIESSVTYPIDQLQKLEEKLSKVAETFKRTQAENQSLLQQLERVKTDSKEGFREREAMEREIQALRSEREDVRNRVARLLEQVEALTKHDSAG